MDNCFAFKTPQTDPHHHTVGHYFATGLDGSIFYCDSYDSRIGYWMTRADAPVARWADELGEFRHNVSERAIGRTYHVIYLDEGRRPWTCLGGWTKAEEAQATIDAHRAALQENA